MFVKCIKSNFMSMMVNYTKFSYIVFPIKYKCTDNSKVVHQFYFYDIRKNFSVATDLLLKNNFFYLHLTVFIAYKMK